MSSQENTDPRFSTTAVASMMGPAVLINDERGPILEGRVKIPEEGV